MALSYILIICFFLFGLFAAFKQDKPFIIGIYSLFISLPSIVLGNIYDNITTNLLVGFTISLTPLLLYLILKIKYISKSNNSGWNQKTFWKGMKNQVLIYSVLLNLLLFVAVMLSSREAGKARSSYSRGQKPPGTAIAWLCSVKWSVADKPPSLAEQPTSTGPLSPTTTDPRATETLSSDTTTNEEE